MTIGVAFFIIIWIKTIKEEDFIKQAIILGLLGYFFYAYGIYVIERIYNPLYLLYMAIFGLSFYSMFYSLASFQKETLQQAQLPKRIRNLSIIFLLISPIIFIPLWTTQILILIETNQKIEFYYSIYILDLCFIMPLFIIATIMLARNQGLGLILTPALFIKAFTLLFSVALGAILAPFYNQIINIADLVLYLTLSLLYLILILIFSRNIIH